MNSGYLCVVHIECHASKYDSLDQNHLKLVFQGASFRLILHYKRLEIAEKWRINYNTFRPHSSLKGQTPDAFVKAWKEENQQPKKQEILLEGCTASVSYTHLTLPT